MKKSAALILFIFLLKTSPGLCQDFWEEIVLPDTLAMSNSDILFDESGTVFLGTNKCLIKSFDNGLTWINTGLNTVASLMAFAPNSDLYSVTMCNTNPCLVKSSDYGDTWDEIYIWEDTPGFSGVFISSDYHIIYGAMDGIYISIDSGFTWSDTLIIGDNFKDFIEKDGVYFSGSINFLIEDQGGIYNSYDQGISWQQISLPGYGISSFALDQDNNLLCSVDFQYNYEAFGVFRSTDGGFSWANILPDYFVTSIVVDVNGGIYAGCDSDFGPAGVQYSPDNGNTWSALNSGLHEDASIVSLAISPNGYIYAVSVFPTRLYRNINPIVQVEEYSYKQAKICIIPNPCTNLISVKIENSNIYEMNNNLLVKVISPLGITCLEDNIEVYKSNEFSLDVSDLKKGMYFIKVILQRSNSILLSSFIKIE